MEKPRYATPKFSHLEEGIKQITVCLDTLDTSKRREFLEDQNLEMSGAQEIRYLRLPEENPLHDELYEKESNIQFKRGVYVMSEANEKNKYSEKFFDCIGLVIVGIDEKTGKNISIITHQKPARLLNTEYFGKEDEEEYLKTIKNFVAQCKKGTVDALIIGGKIKKGGNVDGDPETYIKGVQKVSSMVAPLIGFEPTVVTGPKVSISASEDAFPTDIFFDTKKRRLYLFMPEQIDTNLHEDFKPSDIEIKMKKFQENFEQRSIIENFPQIKWKRPDFDVIFKEKGEMKRVLESEFSIDDKNSKFAEIGKNFVSALENGEYVDLSEDIWSKLENTDSYSEIPKGELSKAQEYAAHYKKNFDGILKAIQEERDVNAPMIVRHEGHYHLIAGNTRLMIARALSQTPKVLIADFSPTK